RHMERTVFVDPDVKTLLRRFVTVKVDAEKDEGVDLARGYRVTSYPTIVFLDGEGEEIDRILGTLPAPDFVRTFEGFLAVEGKLGALLAELRQRPDDLDLALAVGNRYAEHEDVESAHRYLDRVIRHELAARSDSDVGERAMLALADVYARSERY